MHYLFLLVCSCTLKKYVFTKQTETNNGENTNRHNLISQIMY